MHAVSRLKDGWKWKDELVHLDTKGSIRNTRELNNVTLIMCIYLHATIAKPIVVSDVHC